MTIGQRIRAEREARGIGRKQLADAVGIPYPTLAGLENGEQATSTVLPQIAEALEVSVKWLQTGEGSKAAASQSMGFDFEKILDAQKLLREYAAIRGEPLHIADDARYLRVAYKIIDEDTRTGSRGDLVPLMKQLSAVLDNERRAEDGDKRREAEGAGAGDGGDRTGRKRKTKAASG